MEGDMEDKLVVGVHHACAAFCSDELVAMFVTSNGLST